MVYVALDPPILRGSKPLPEQPWSNSQKKAPEFQGLFQLRYPAKATRLSRHPG